MGCWNETCMLSNLPIMGGVECYLLYLIEATPGEGGCGVCDSYRPLLPPILGTYDEYGRIEDYEVWADTLAFPMSKPGVKPTDLVKFQELIRPGTLLIEGPKRHVYPTFIRKDVWDMAIHMSGSDPNNVNGEYFYGFSNCMQSQPRTSEVQLRKGELRVLVYFMQRMRKAFHVPSGSGSQQAEFTLPWAFNRYVSQLAKDDKDKVGDYF